MSAWAAFWLFLAVFVICEAYLYDRGHETAIYKHKTPAELELQRIAIEQRKAKDTTT
jgi:hypothetical protein